MSFAIAIGMPIASYPFGMNTISYNNSVVGILISSKSSSWHAWVLAKVHKPV